MIDVLVAVIAVLLIFFAAGLMVGLKSPKTKNRLLGRTDTAATKGTKQRSLSRDGQTPDKPEPDKSTADDLKDLEGTARSLPSPPDFAARKEVASDTPPDRSALPAEGEQEESKTVFRLRDRLAKTGGILASPFASLRAKGRFDAQIYDQLEEAMIMADVGVATTTKLLDLLKAAVGENRLQARVDELADYLKNEVVSILDVGDTDLKLYDQPGNVWLMVGVNGVGKTTTIGKLAYKEAAAGKKVVLAAGDTFRAAAADQLELWAGRAKADFIRGASGADPSSVVFDAIQHGVAVDSDLVIADSAGRLHNKTNLMEELKKIRRIADRPPGKVAEVLLVIDATTGQNGLIQARQFTEAVGVTGIVLTKLDGTAKGGIVLAIAEELKLPIKLVGVGESIEDLVPLDKLEFAEALIGISDNNFLGG